MDETTSKSGAGRLTTQDLLTLTKFRLSVLVVVTTLVGFWLRKGPDWSVAQLLHTLVGATLAAFGAAVFNQLMEIEPDSRMERTADRPLPSGRISPTAAFVIGWLFSALALVHLTLRVNLEAAAITALTLVVYLFIYTPLKRQSAINTLVGAVSGALPPLIGWVGAAGARGEHDPFFRWSLLVEPGAIYLFALLFLWQLPHFLAINWMYREEYLKGGFVMLANEDEAGKKTSTHALAYAVAAVLLMLYPAWEHLVYSWVFVPGGLLLSGWLCGLAWRFFQDPTRATARRLFFCTLAWLPAVLFLTVMTWRSRP